MKHALLKCCAIASVGFLNTLCLNTLNFLALLYVLWQKQGYATCLWAKAGRSHTCIWPLKLNYYFLLKIKAIKLFVKVEQTLLHSWGEAEV